MCGISGIVGLGAGRHSEAQRQMVKSLHHRGPDGNGTYSFENCSLGHNRLSIIDLASGAQPMLNHDKQTCIVFNGEIYGYKDIRKTISYDYSNTSDTEVILAMYQKYGEQLLEHLPGMFAFGIWDNQKQQFFAARDRFGEKPLFYTITSNNELVFASELKAICASGLVKTEVDNSSVARYLSYGYTGPVKTIYKNIYSLPPAHYLIYRDGKLTVKRYWNYPETTSEDISLSDAAEKFEELFASAVKKQMVADVEVCAFLSGGLDSTSVVSFAHKYNPKLKTLAFGYKGQHNELPYAREAADEYKTDHYELLEENANTDELFLKLSDIYDEPFSDSSALATYSICKLASDFGKVVLTGDGGDELLGGYTWWYKPMLDEIAARGTSDVKSMFVFALAASEKLFSSPTSRKWREKRISINNSRKYKSVVESAVDRNVYPDISRILGLPDVEPFDAFWVQDNTINDAMKYDIAHYMPGDILVKTDRASMANSLELRAPFLDVDLASYCISMPGKYKITKDADKILLREAMGKYWPKGILNRDKQGFGVSGDYWKKSEKLNALRKEYVFSKNSPLYNILSYDETQLMLKNNPGMLQSIFILALWSEKNNKI